MARQQLANIGFGTAVLGLLVTLLCLTPLSSPNSVFPWPLVAGSTIYLLGALCTALNARGESGKRLMGWLRFVRIGIVVIVLFLLQRMVAT